MNDVKNYDYKYYDYVLNIQSIIMIIFAIYINQFALWYLRNHYYTEEIGTTLTIMTIIAVVLLILFRKQMDNIKKDSWILYNLVIVFTIIIYALTIRTIFTSGIIDNVDTDYINRFLNEVMYEGGISEAGLRSVRTLICLDLTHDMFIYCIVSVITNFVSFSKRRDFFAN